MSMQVLSADDALAAIDRCAFIDDDGCEIVHAQRGTIGADWNADSAREAVRTAKAVAWVKHWIWGWCLAVEHGPGLGRSGVTVFDGVRPEAEPA